MHPHDKVRRKVHGHMTLPEITVDESTPQAYRVFHAMRGVMHAQKQLLTRRLGEKNAHLGQSYMLWILSRNEGLSPSELADALSVKRPTITVMLKKMERAGLVERWLDEQDQRYVRVRLTKTGKALQADLKQVHDEVIQTTVGNMSEEDQRELERLLRVVEDNLDGALRADEAAATDGTEGD